ncbi:MAG: DUF1109 domain-containing protein [Betaproteobacteria bacterium]|nr:DUF1109 domain-containing protein [Betaproteobacteria bacterium]
MKTEELVDLLATGAEAVAPNAVRRRYALALVASVPVAIALMATWLGVRPDLNEAAVEPMFWGKVAFVALLSGAGLMAVARLSRPGASLAVLPGLLAAPVLAMWLAAAAALAGAAPGERMELFLGISSDECALNIAVLSLPVFVAALWAMKGLAPTRLRLAGAGAGLLAGAVAALVYTLHCPESDAPFIGTWYVLGILIPVAAGALLGPRLLRW